METRAIRSTRKDFPIKLGAKLATSNY